MSMIITNHQMHLSLRGEGVESAEEIKREIDKFVGQVHENDIFTISVVLAVKNTSSPAITIGSDALRTVLNAFELSLGIEPLRSFLKEKGISRSSWYNWKARGVILPRNLELLILIAPTPEVKQALIELRS